MSSIKLGFLVVLLSSLISCAHGNLITHIERYDINKTLNTVNYYEWSGDDTKATSIVVEDADASTFEPVKCAGYSYKPLIDEDFISTYDSCSYFGLQVYGKDKDHVYFKGKLLTGADPKTFTYIDYDAFKDQNSIYFYGEKLTGADVKSFKYLVNDYYTDINNVYYLNKKISSDVTNFKVLMSGTGYTNYAKDSLSVFKGYYFNGKYNIDILTGRDVKTFTILSYKNDTTFSKDKNGVYVGQSKSYEPSTEIMLTGLDLSSVKIKSNYLTDGKKVFYLNHELNFIDPKSFEAAEYHFIKDENGVYYNGFDSLYNPVFYYIPEASTASFVSKFPYTTWSNDVWSVEGNDNKYKYKVSYSGSIIGIEATELSGNNTVSNKTLLETRLKEINFSLPAQLKNIIDKLVKAKVLNKSNAIMLAERINNFVNSYDLLALKNSTDSKKLVQNLLKLKYIMYLLKEGYVK